VKEARKDRAFVAIDVSSRSPGPMNIMVQELAGDLGRLKVIKPEKAAEVARDWVRFRGHLRAVDEGQAERGAPVKFNARLVRELLDVLPEELRLEYNRRRGEIEGVAVNISGAREGYYRAGDPVIYTQSENILESGTKRRFHPSIVPSAGDVYVRIGDDQDKIVDAVRRKVREGGEVTLSGGYFTNCIPQTAVLLAAAGFEVVVPERLTDAKIVRDRNKPGETADMLVRFITAVNATADLVQDRIRPHEICVREEKEGGYGVWRFRKEPAKA